MGAAQTDQGGPIVVPVDFSSDSEAALLWAARAAECLDQPLIVLHVVHDPESAPGYYQIGDESGHVQRLEEAAAAMLKEFVERIRQENPDLKPLQEVETSLAVGLPPTRILEVAQKRGASLIVMGSQGRTGLAHLLLGSKAQRVVQLSPVPVTIVKGRPSLPRRG